MKHELKKIVALLVFVAAMAFTSGVWTSTIASAATAPDAPTGFYQNIANTTSISVQWKCDDYEDYVDGYRIQTSTDGKSWTTVLLTEDSSYVWRDLTPGSTYYCGFEANYDLEIYNAQTNKPVTTLTFTRATSDRLSYKFKNNILYKCRARAYVTVNGTNMYSTYTPYQYFAIPKITVKKQKKKLVVTWQKMHNLSGVTIKIHKIRETESAVNQVYKKVKSFKGNKKRVSVHDTTYS